MVKLKTRGQIVASVPIWVDGVSNELMFNKFMPRFKFSFLPTPDV